MTTIPPEQISRIQSAMAARSGLLNAHHSAALRLFNGYSEGCPGLVIDLYAHTVVIFNQLSHTQELEPLISLIQGWLVERYPWVKAVIIKTRHAVDDQKRRGVLVYGEQPDIEMSEFGVRYALDLTMNQDASIYLDTRNLRGWLLSNSRGKRVLNTFAFTGSLGAAALAGGAAQVVQLDLNVRFMSLARRTYALNGFQSRDQDFLTGDFFRKVAQLKREGTLFDCVILDPPYFSVTEAGRVDLAAENSRLINKVRPLIAHNGCLIAVNNALFVSGEEYLASLKALCSDGYLQLEEIIPVPMDVTGYPETIHQPNYPADPTPFNHPTKCAILRVQRKDHAG